MNEKLGWKGIYTAKYIIKNNKKRSDEKITSEAIKTATEEFLANGGVINKCASIDAGYELKKARLTQPRDDAWWQRYTRQIGEETISDRYDFSNDPISDLFK